MTASIFKSGGLQNILRGPRILEETSVCLYKRTVCARKDNRVKCKTNETFLATTCGPRLLVGSSTWVIKTDRICSLESSACKEGKQKCSRVIHADRVYSQTRPRDMLAFVDPFFTTFDRNLSLIKPPTNPLLPFFFYFSSLNSIKTPPSPPLKLDFPSNLRSELRETTAILFHLSSSTNLTQNSV